MATQYEYTRYGAEGQEKIMRREVGSSSDWQEVTSKDDIAEAEIELRVAARLREESLKRIAAGQVGLSVRRLN